MSQRSEYAKHHQAPKTYREGLPPIPDRMRYLRVDKRGYPVPWFVHVDENGPDFRIIRSSGMAIAVNKRLCWICGGPLGKHLVFAIGPMCMVNRVTSEPPSHRECAEFAVKACPFMILPQSKRRLAGLELKETTEPAGVSIERNPGVTCLYEAATYRPFKVSQSGAQAGWLLELGVPQRVDYWREGREATRAEAWESIRSGMPLLIEAAQRDGVPAVQLLGKQYQAALSLLPVGDPVPGLDSAHTDPAPAVPGLERPAPSLVLPADRAGR